MSNPATGSVVRQLGALFQGGSMAGLSDAELLGRFVSDRDEPAFAALVDRHGPMVLNVCRQLLGDHQHAEDAFQAVFLVLARRARGIRDPERLGNWLHGVAVRTSRCARQKIERRRRHEEAGASGARLSSPTADQAVIDREHAEALHAEVRRLPRAFRSAVVLCYFEGLTLDEAARRLRCPAGTLRSRLARARDKLRTALTRRGIAPAVGLVDRSTPASIPPLLCESTARAAIAFAARNAAGAPISASAAALAREVLRSMLTHTSKFVFMAALTLATLATGAVGLTSSTATKDEPAASTVVAVSRTDPEPRAPDPEPGPGRMIVDGRVLDPDGKPVPHASVVVHAHRPERTHPAVYHPLLQAPIGNARSDASGRFRIDAPRTSSSRYELMGAVAVAPGFGVGWVALDADDDRPYAEITLRPEQVIEGRLFDVQGRPAAGVTVSVSALRPLSPSRPPAGRLPSNTVTYGWTSIAKYPAWPRPVVSDAEGRFTLRGLGRGVRATLTAFHPKYGSSGGSARGA